MTWVEATWNITSAHLLCAKVSIHNLVATGTKVNPSCITKCQEINNLRTLLYMHLCVCLYVCRYTCMYDCIYVCVCKYGFIITHRYIEKFNTVFLSFLDCNWVKTEHVNVHVGWQWSKKLSSDSRWQVSDELVTISYPEQHSSMVKFSNCDPMEYWVEYLLLRVCMFDK